MESHPHLLFLLICFAAPFHLALSGEMEPLDSVPALGRTLYKVIDAFPCVRLLNLSGEIGCANPGRGKVIAPLVRFANVNATTKPSTILVTLDNLQDLLERAANDKNFAEKISGVLLEPGSDTRDKLKGFSPAEKFPLAKFAPYQNTSHEWNPDGSGIMWNAYDFPVFLLSSNSTSILLEAVLKNEKRKQPHNIDVAEFNSVMQDSVWSSLPPISASSSESSKTIILAVTSMDSASFFRDKSFGADSPISGLVAMLAAADALSHIDDSQSFKKQLVFLIFTGEAWGYIGSRRFLHELDLQSDSTRGLNFSLIDVVLEIGSVGKGYGNGVNTFYAHAAG
ncbi:Nicastrin-like protein, partial [Drosera capensis]